MRKKTQGKLSIKSTLGGRRSTKGDLCHLREERMWKEEPVNIVKYNRGLKEDKRLFG